MILLAAVAAFVIPGQEQTRQAPAPPAEQTPSGPQPQDHEIKASNGNEGGHPHHGSGIANPAPLPQVLHRPAAPTEPSPPSEPATTPAPARPSGA